MKKNKITIDGGDGFKLGFTFAAGATAFGCLPVAIGIVLFLGFIGNILAGM